MTWLLGWNYKKYHTLVAGVGAGVNYQVPITVHFGDGDDGDDDMYCNENCNEDFTDIRFTTSNGFSLIDYWLQSKVDSDNAVFWLKVPGNLDVNQLICVYFGNADAESESDIDNTFIDVIEDVVLGLPINEGVGSTCNDYSGNNYDGTIAAAQWTATGKFGDALEFDGESFVDVDQINCGNSINPTANLTLAAWIKPDIINSYDQDCIFAKRDDAAHRAWVIGLTDTGAIRLDVWDAAGAVHNMIAGSVVASVPQLIVGTSDGANLKIYLDGVSVGVSVACIGINDVSATSYIGYEIENGRVFDGVIGPVYIFSSCLSQEKITNLYSGYGDPTLVAGSCLVRKWATTTLPTHGAWNSEGPATADGGEKYYYYKTPFQPISKGVY